MSFYESKSFSVEIFKDIDKVFELERKLILVVKLVFSKIASAKSAFGRAKYALGQEKNNLNIFEKGYFELSNDSTKRADKKSVMGRKNWLFTSTFEGARANAVALSLIIYG